MWSPARTELPSPMDERVIVIPAQGTETPVTRSKMSGIASCSSPEVRIKIGSASPETAKRVAFRLYESLKQHGLQAIAEQAFKQEETERGELTAAAKEERKREELMGMECLLKDGFVSYLRDVAKITPPVPHQIASIVSAEEERKREELMGMECLLKDGFVSNLRDVAKITPPIPHHVCVV